MKTVDALIDERSETWPAGLYRRRDSFRYRRNYGGRRILEVWGDIPEVYAIRKAARYNLDLEEGIIPDNARSKNIDFHVFAYDVWLKKKAGEIRSKSLARYRAVVDNFNDYLENVKVLQSVSMGAITYEIASDYISHRADTPLMPNGQKKFTRKLKDGASKKTLHFERELLAQLFKEAVKREIVKYNPFADVRPKKPSTQEIAAAHHPLTIEEEGRLLQVAEEMDKSRLEKDNPCFHDLLLFLVRTGLRENEMRNLEWSDINWRDGLIQVRMKTVAETRSIPIPEAAVSGFKRKLKGKAPKDPVFKDEKSIKTLGARLRIRDAKALLGINVADIDMRNLRIVSTRVYKWEPKGSSGAVPMCASVRALLTRLEKVKTSNFVFAHWDGGLCRVNILVLLKIAQKKANIPGRLRVHDLRHTLAVRLRNRGVALETIMGILRHANIRETLIYAPYSLDEGRTAMGKLDEPPASTPIYVSSSSELTSMQSVLSN